MAKIDFELFDAVDHCQNSVAGTLKAEMRRPKFRDLIEDHRAEMELDLRRCVMRDHGAQIFEPSPDGHDRANADKRQDQLIERHAFENFGDQPAEQCQARDTEQDSQYANRDGPINPPSDTLGKAP